MSSFSGGYSYEKFDLAVRYTCRSKCVSDRANGDMSFATRFGLFRVKKVVYDIYRFRRVREY